jgi:hypothetical protein
LIDQAAQGSEQIRHALDFVNHHKFVLVPGEVELGIFQPFAVHVRFQIEVNALTAFRDGVRQGSFADLPWAEQRHRREEAEAVLDNSLETAQNHSCNYGMLCQICKSCD